MQEAKTRSGWLASAVLFTLGNLIVAAIVGGIAGGAGGAIVQAFTSQQTVLTVSAVVYAVVGLFALAYGLVEFGFVWLPVPGLHGHVPGFSKTKTLVTHAWTEAARFLGYEVGVLQDDTACTSTGRRKLNGVIGLRVPAAVVRDKCKPYLRHGKPVHRPEMEHDSPYSIVSHYQQEYRGAVEYYQLAYNRHTFNRLKWVMGTSLTKTLAHKLRISVQQVWDRFGATTVTPSGTYRVLMVTVERDGRKAPLVAQWGGISLARRMDAVLNDQPRRVWSVRHTELLERLLADTCELCGSMVDVEVHHVRHLKDLQRKGRGDLPAWVQRMASRHRKTLVVCSVCHHGIHTGRPLQRHTAA